MKSTAAFKPVITEKVEVFGNEAEMAFLRSENVRLMELSETNDASLKGMQKRVSDLGDAKIALAKESKKLASELKFERIAAEGSKKKLAVLEYEVICLREDKKNLLEETSIMRSRVLELETAVSQ
jgi:hypothetical protein